MNTLDSLIPEYLRPRVWGHVNLEAAARRTFSADNGINPLIDPVFAESWVEYLHRAMGIDASYGGYMEDRRWMHRQQYMDENNRVHLGIDINGLGGATRISCPVPFRLMDKRHDKDQNGGWGGRVILLHQGEGKYRNYFLVFGHLHESIWDDLIVGETYPAGTNIGSIAFHEHNGNWFPHLHIQAQNPSMPIDFDTLDGYGNIGEIADLIHRYGNPYPNPLEVLDIHR